ncbi:RNA polymerase Rpc34 [Metschnikowia bicuspidata var. bicuspidata NRRL YB-4993]|uniref:DNA-directed RNA polymerase III subunit RPC6 n=1 Tax=Metschnikowia bicuspidata var. bicuspidata NRRL YB-4993 TaxID=869754 RepID=A0A1A0H8X9_9ASCO|nr:RNA polymerase Rpc34 [Metschnikowia bicuspidata var. bicuspidata NRRL YB-4993]OBA20466.1 RNA polymerase Rpc34 [Metschnikowia bicuspidata var. bicuspidata NRRL YB-4993]
MADTSKADLMYLRMCESPPSKMFTQDELKQIINEPDLVKLLGLTQSLIDRKMMKLVKVGDELRFQAISLLETKKLTSMNDDEQMIYSHIEASGREGIWTKTLKAKTNMHQHIVMRCLKLLELQRYIKLIKSVKHPTRKIYMLYNLQPSIDVTGGPWFTDSELDTEFIDSLLTVIWRFISLKTFPTAFQEPTPNTNIFLSVYPAHHAGFANLDAIMDFIISHKITNIDLGTSDIRALCEVLVFDDKIELVEGSFDVYKATWQSVLEAGYGRQYNDPSLLNDVQKSFVDHLNETHHFDLFDHYAVINDEVAPEDVAHLDAWAQT